MNLSNYVIIQHYFVMHSQFTSRFRNRQKYFKNKYDSVAIRQVCLYALIDSKNKLNGLTSMQFASRTSFELYCERHFLEYNFERNETNIT